MNTIFLSHICILSFLKSNDSNFLLFAHFLSVSFKAPVKQTGTGMRSEREQLIKSSSSRASESQFCLPSAMISFYLKVMSYGTCASGNAMSSISMFHLPHKQGQVISACSYQCNQSNWFYRQTRKRKGLRMIFLCISKVKKKVVCFIVTHIIFGSIRLYLQTFNTDNSESYIVRIIGSGIQCRTTRIQQRN